MIIMLIIIMAPPREGGRASRAGLATFPGRGGAPRQLRGVVQVCVSKCVVGGRGTTNHNKMI